MSESSASPVAGVASPPGSHPTHRLPLGVRIGWGMGGIADNFMANVLFVLGMIIYVTAFKMPAGLAGLALSIPRFVDAVTDPLIGNFSDNLRTRFGRRRPMIAVGAIGSAILLPLMWFPPMLDTVQNPWYSNGPFWYLAISGSLYFIFYTLFMVPYTALGFELTDDYDERTRVLAWRMYLGLIASMTLPMLYWLCRRPIFGDGVEGEIHGTRWVSAILGLVVLVTGLIPVFSTRERPEASKQETTPILPAIGQTLTNGPFLILLIAYIGVIMGLLTAGTIGTFALIYYVYQQAETVNIAKDNAAVLGAIIGVLAGLTSYLSMYLAAWVSRKTGKRPAMMLGMALILTGTLSIWFLYDPQLLINDDGFFLTRWLAGGWELLGFEANPSGIKSGVLLATFVTALGLQGCWLMIDSMTADICDEDELRTGRRREGMFGAVQGFARKLAVAATVAIGGYLLQWLGFDPEAAEQAGGVSDPVARKMLLTLMVCQGGGVVFGLLVFFFYPITRQRAEATRTRLEARRGEASVPAAEHDEDPETIQREAL